MARMVGGLAAGLALLSLVWLARDRFEQKRVADAFYACSNAARLGGDLDVCLPGIADRVRQARRSEACEAALLPRLRDETRFAMAQSCGAGVKRLAAAFDTAEAGRADAEAQLTQARRDTGRAVERAEARSTRQQQRKTHAQDIIDRAPRGAGGAIACDADCLRRLGR